MAKPVIIIAAESSGVIDSDDTYSGTSDLVKYSFSYVCTSTGRPKIALLADASLNPYTGTITGVSTDGSECIRLNNSDSTYAATLPITGIDNSYTVGDGTTVYLTWDTGTSNYLCNGCSSSVFAVYDVIYLGGDIDAILYVTEIPDSTHVVIANAGTAGVQYDFKRYKQISVGGKYARIKGTDTTPISAVIGGRNPALEGALTFKLVGNGGQFDADNGWTIWDKVDRTVTAANKRFDAVSTNSSAGEPIIIKGRSASDPTVITYSGTISVYSSQSAQMYGVTFKDFDFVCNISASNTAWVYTDYFGIFNNIEMNDGTYTWYTPCLRMRGKLINSYLKFSYNGLRDFTYVDGSTVICTGSVFSATNSGLIYTANSIFISGYSSPTLLYVTGGNITNCVFYNVILRNAGTVAAPTVTNCSFSYSSALSGYAITFNTTTIYGNFVYYGGGGSGNNYYNCTGLVDTTTYPGADQIFTNTTNINPGYTDIANGDPTNTALLGQGYPTKYPNTTVNTNASIGAHQAAYSTGGGTTVLVLED